MWDACAGRGGKTLAPLSWACSTSPPAIRTSPGCGHEDDAKAPCAQGPAAVLRSSATEPALRARPKIILPDVHVQRPRHAAFGTLTCARSAPCRPGWSPNAASSMPWSYLPSGGHLAYITCTMNPAAEGQIDAFLARTPGAPLEKQWQSTPDAFGRRMYGAMLKKHKKR